MGGGAVIICNVIFADSRSGITMKTRLEICLRREEFPKPFDNRVYQYIYIIRSYRRNVKSNITMTIEQQFPAVYG